MNKKQNKLSVVLGFAITLLFIAVISQTTVLAIHEPFHIATNSTDDSTTNEISNFAAYENSNLGLRIEYPADWQEEEEENRVAFISPAENTSDTDLESVAISLFPAGTVSFFPSNNIPFGELVNKTIDYLRQSKSNFDLIESKQITLKDKPAHMLVYNYGPSNNDLTKSSAVLTTNGENMYIVSYFAEPAKYSIYLPVLQQMLNSLEVSTIDSGSASEQVNGDGDGGVDSDSGGVDSDSGGVDSDSGGVDSDSGDGDSDSGDGDSDSGDGDSDSGDGDGGGDSDSGDGDGGGDGGGDIEDTGGPQPTL